MDHFKNGDQYFRNLTKFMDEKKCCGSNGTIAFIPKINVNDSFYMATYCHNLTSEEHKVRAVVCLKCNQITVFFKVGCYKKFTAITKKTIDDVLNYIVLGSIAILSFCFVLYGTFLKTTSTSPKKVGDKLKKAFKSSKSYVGRKISKKFKK